jgi:hypothetical protein
LPESAIKRSKNTEENTVKSVFIQMGIGEQRAENREQRAENREQRTESREQRAESREGC